MKKNKGFTIVELLVVIGIIAALFSFAVPNIMKISSNMKNKANDTLIKNLESAAGLYAKNNANIIKNDTKYEECFNDSIKEDTENCTIKTSEKRKTVYIKSKVSIGTLIEEGYYTVNESNCPKDSSCNLCSLDDKKECLDEKEINIYINSKNSNSYATFELSTKDVD